MWTWKHQNGENKNLIDYILLNERKAIMNFEVLQRFKYHSDHRIIRSTLDASRNSPD